MANRPKPHLAEPTLWESEQRFRKIFEEGPLGIAFVALDYRILKVNQTLCRMLGYTESELNALSFPDITHPDHKTSDLDQARNLIDGTISLYKTEKRYLKKKGSVMWVVVTLSIIHAESGQPLYFLAMIEDIDARKKMEADRSRLQLENVYLQEEIKSEHVYSEIVGASVAMKAVFDNIKKVAATDATVLITGETGTGKELIAHAIHKESSRKNGALIKVNCAALPGGLIESELFGHEKGAFTGAIARKKGRFELADGGTIFLDEVGELPLETQVKLLRVLQEQQFERVGGTQTVKVNVRVIAATNRNLQDAVQQGGFRPDLYYRLNIFPIRVPALRERVEDLPLLVNYLVQQFSRRMAKRVEVIQPQALDKLLRYPWPGNVRELANLLERAVILCDGRVLKSEHIGITMQPAESETNFRTMNDAERQHILRALEKTNGVLSGPNGAARLLGMNRSTLWSRIRKLGINISKESLEYR